MNENEEEIGVMTSDCGYYFCSTNTCGVGKQATVEYCYDPKEWGGALIGTHCGCGFYS